MLISNGNRCTGFRNYGWLLIETGFETGGMAIKQLCNSYHCCIVITIKVLQNTNPCSDRFLERTKELVLI